MRSRCSGHRKGGRCKIAAQEMGVSSMMIALALASSMSSVNLSVKQQKEERTAVDFWVENRGNM